MSEYEIRPELAGRINATNYDIADIVAVINGDAVKEQVNLDVEVKEVEE